MGAHGSIPWLRWQHQQQRRRGRGNSDRPSEPILGFHIMSISYNRVLVTYPKIQLTKKLYTDSVTEFLELSEYFNWIKHVSLNIWWCHLNSSVAKWIVISCWHLTRQKYQKLPQWLQEAQLPQRNSASAVHVLYLGWLTDRAMHRTLQNRRGCTIFWNSDIQTLWFNKCWPKTHFVMK